MFLLLLAALVLDEPVSYKSAFVAAMNDKKPVVVVVTMPNCVPCQQLKTVLKTVDMSGVHYAQVDRSKQQKIARQITKGKPGAPQIVGYFFEGDRWVRKTLTWPYNRVKIQHFLRRIKPINHRDRPGPDGGCG